MAPRLSEVPRLLAVSSIACFFVWLSPIVCAEEPPDVDGGMQCTAASPQRGTALLQVAATDWALRAAREPVAASSHSAAVSVKSKTKAVTKLKFGQDVDYPPYAFKNETTGELTGFGKDIADGMTAMCEDLEIEVVKTKWNDCWSGASGDKSSPTLGASLQNGTLDACMTYTHTQGIRNEFADFSYGILETNKGAGLLALLEDGKESKVTGLSDLTGKKVVDVAGWAPTADGLGYVVNKCTGQKYSGNYTLLVGPSNDESLKMVLNGTADAMFVYSDQAYNYQCKDDDVEKEWNCSLWSGFGTKFAYVQTGQFGYTVNGTTLALSKKGSGVPEKVNPCLARFMGTKEYHDICVKYGLTESCYANDFFTTADEQKKPYNYPTNEQTGDCSDGYCPCSNTHRYGVNFVVLLLPLIFTITEVIYLMPKQCL